MTDSCPTLTSLSVFYEGLLTPGDRPAGALMETLERAAAAAAVDPDGWCALSAAQGFSHVVALRALANVPIDPYRIDWLAAALQSVCFLFPAEDVTAWERKGAWTVSLSESALAIYRGMIEGPTPSVAYRFSGAALDGARMDAFRVWLSTTPVGRIRSLLRLSADRLERWVQCQPGYRPEPTLQRARDVAAGMGYPETLGVWCGVLETLADVAPCSAAWWGLLHHAAAGKPVRLLGLWGQALGLPLSAWESLAAPGSPWVDAGFLRPLSRDDALFHLNVTSEDSWGRVWAAWTDNRRQRHLLQEGGDPLAAVARPYAADPATWPLPSWVDQWIAALRQEKPVRLLLWGDSLLGSRELVAYVLAQAGKTGWVPAGDVADKAKEQEGNAEARHKSAMHFMRVVDLLAKRPSAVLVAEEWAPFICVRGDWERSFHAPRILQHPRGHQIWTVPALSGNLATVPASVRALFHDVRKMEEPTLSARQTLARTWFSEETALKVARAVAAPGRLRALGEWSLRSGVTDWDSLVGRITAEDEAELQSQDRGIPLTQWVRVVAADLPPLGGYPEAQAFLDRTADAFARPATYAALGARWPCGVLLLGEPGCGKTLLARHLAARVNVGLLVVDTAGISDDVKRLKFVFQEARRRAPCVVFFDEADVLLGDPRGLGGPDPVKQRLVNAMLAELDGVQTNEGVFVVAATHRGNRLDPAVTRSGRLSEVVHLGLPGPDDRAAIWQGHLGQRPCAPCVRAGDLAGVSQGFTGADIAEAINRAALACARRGAPALTRQALDDSCTEVYWGLPSDSLHLDPEERWTTAVHEAGHAIVAWAYGLTVPRITIRPRRHALGMTQWQRSEGVVSLDRRSHLAQMALAMGGLAAETQVFGHFGSGGTGDLQSAHQIAQRILATGQEGLHLVLNGGMDHWSDGRRSRHEASVEALMADSMKAAEACIRAAGSELEAFARDVLAQRELSGAALLPWLQRFQGLAARLASEPVGHRGTSVEGTRATVHRDDGQEERLPP